MATSRKILIFAHSDTPDSHPTNEIAFIFNHDRHVRDRGPELVLYYAPGEKISTADIVELLRAEGVIQNGRVAARNGSFLEYSFIISLAEIARRIIVEWIKARKGRRIEIRKGKMKVSAPTAKELNVAFASLAKYEKLGVTVKQAQSKKTKKSRK